MKRLLVVAALAAAGFAVLPAAPAAAHPLGNFSVSTHAGLTLHADRVDALAVADLAELPTLQDAPPTCDEAAAALHVRVGGAAARWTVENASLTYTAGAAGLRTSRLECRLSAPITLGGATRVEVANTFRADRIGWHELVAIGAGVSLDGSSLPTTSPTDELRSYPTDPLASPAGVRSASFTASPGENTAASSAGDSPATAALGDGRATAGPEDGAAAAGPADGAAVAPGGTRPGDPDVLAAESSIGRPAGLLAGAERTLDSLIGGDRLTPLVGLLAVLLALVLGAAHAALPGHGKTVMAAYLAGSRGRPRDAVLVGATVTFTHTAGVIALGLLLTAVSGIAGETVLGWLGLASGVLVFAVGIAALTSAVRRYRAARRGNASSTTDSAHRHSDARTHADSDRSADVHSDRSAHVHSDDSDHVHCDRSSHVHGDRSDHVHGDRSAPVHSHSSSIIDNDGAILVRSGNPSPIDSGKTLHSHGHRDDHGAGYGHHDPGPGHGRHAHDHGPGHGGHAHDHGLEHGGHAHDHGSGHGGHAHDHGLGHGGHAHDHGPGKWGLAGLGVAGGLVPSPSALIVLLGAAALGRTVFGVLLVLAYGLGMAATLTAAGLLLVRLRHRIDGHWGLARRWQAISPPATAALIIVVGLGLAGRALAGVA